MSLKKDLQTDALFESMLALGTVEECYRFFEDLCTAKEIRDMAQRLQVAALMRSGSSYAAAQQITGASSATIGRVKRCLDYGTGGYELILERIKGEDGDEAR